jgi:hypothetical protein
LKPAAGMIYLSKIKRSPLGLWIVPIKRKGEMGKVLWKLRQEGFLASCYSIKGKVTLVGYFHKEKATSV